MYTPEHFVEADANEIAALIAAFPLAVVVASTADGLVANHLPLLQRSDGVLVGHVAAKNDLHRTLPVDAEVLAIFRGDDAYVSPNWYPSKADHHKHVPTWNYEVVHCHGRIRFHADVKTKIAAVGRLTKDLEARTNGPEAWRMADAPHDYMKTMLDGIVAFEIVVTRTLAKSKLSQNRDARDHASVVDSLATRGHGRMADRMKRGGPAPKS